VIRKIVVSVLVSSIAGLAAACGGAPPSEETSAAGSSALESEASTCTGAPLTFTAKVVNVTGGDGTPVHKSVATVCVNDATGPSNPPAGTISSCDVLHTISPTPALTSAGCSSAGYVTCFAGGYQAIYACPAGTFVSLPANLKSSNLNSLVTMTASSTTPSSQWYEPYSPNNGCFKDAQDSNAEFIHYVNTQDAAESTVGPGSGNCSYTCAYF
jgi:hypothetical protein